jgi:hypothetical protein
MDAALSSGPFPGPGRYRLHYPPEDRLIPEARELDVVLLADNETLWWIDPWTKGIRRSDWTYYGPMWKWERLSAEEG